MDGSTALKQTACQCASHTSMGEVIAARYVHLLQGTPPQTFPFRHWLLTKVLPCGVARAVTALPLELVKIADTYGKRDTHNAMRRFFDEGNQKKYEVCGAIASAFQSRAVIDAITTICGVDLEGSYLRIEYCQDSEGFWLEPHTDIGAKLFTMVVYLTEGALGETMGTDIYDDAHKHVGRAPSPFNSAIVFVPAANSWHGFERRPMPDVRKSLIVNYVKPEWRTRHELCFPNTPIGKYS